jgi:hypothetical protein
MYHNTLAHEGDQLRNYEQKAMTQDELVLEYFRRRRFGDHISPTVVHRYALPAAPITSVRRALTNLTAAGLLVKTDVMVEGAYGRPESTWILSDPVQGELL